MGTVRYNGYGDRKPAMVTRRAFYSKSDGYYDRSDKFIPTTNGCFEVPQYWATFTAISGYSELAPQGFQSLGRVLPENVLKWEVDTNNEASAEG